MAQLQTERADRVNSGKEEILFNEQQRKNAGEQQFVEDAQRAQVV